jgi:hypothetical protein
MSFTLIYQVAKLVARNLEILIVYFYFIHVELRIFIIRFGCYYFLDVANRIKTVLQSYLFRIEVVSIDAG